MFTFISIYTATQAYLYDVFHICKSVIRVKVRLYIWKIELCLNDRAGTDFWCIFIYLYIL